MRYVNLFIVGVAMAMVVSCSGPSKRLSGDTSTSGTIHISVDESFKPVIDSQIQVFESQYPKAKIIVDYKSEAECIKDLSKDSTRMVIITRGLSEDEEKYYKNKFKFLPAYGKVANDAIAVIVNNKAPDSLFTLNKIRGILDGTTGDKQIAVLDGLSETSVVRFVIDSILQGKPFDKNKVFAAKNSTDVINYITTNPNAIGFVGVSWIGNKEDTAQLSFLQKVKIASLQCNCPDKSYVKPYQYNIMTRRYPLVRGLYYVLKENYDGLGSAFANFLEAPDRGQLIFQRAYLGPAKVNFTLRSATY